MFGIPQGPELIIILVIVLIVFGAGKLPSVMRDFGRGVKEFKRAQTDEEIAAEAAQKQQQERPAAASTQASAPPPAEPAHQAQANGATSTRTSEPAPRA